MIKVIGTAYRREDFTPEDFIKYWIDVHGPISARVGPMRGYVVSEVTRKLHGQLESEAFVEQWWDSEEDFQRANESPEMVAAWEDVQKYARMDGTFWVTKEHILIPPPVHTKGLLVRDPE